MTNRAEPERRILLIEDDKRIGESLRRALEASGYQTRWAATAGDGEVAFHAALETDNPFDLVLLDLGLPDADGLDVCRRLVTADPVVPVIILTARDEELDLVVGLDAGAIDYITKPFSLANVLARLRAQLRRITQVVTVVDVAVVAAEGRLSSNVEIAQGVVIDLRARKVFVDGFEVPMRPKEFDLLARLMRDSGTVVRREDLMADVWDENWFGSTKTLDFHIAALRTKLDQQHSERVSKSAASAATASRITTIRGVGFRFEQ